MTGMVEIIARAIFNADQEGLPKFVQRKPFDKWDEVEVKPRYMKFARAALTALREPTEGMSLAGLVALVECAPKWTDDEEPYQRALKIGRTLHGSRDTDAAFCAMIDAALQEEG